MKCQTKDYFSKKFYWLQKRHKNNLVKNIDIIYKSVSQDAANMENVDEMPDDHCEDENFIGEYDFYWKTLDFRLGLLGN